MATGLLHAVDDQCAQFLCQLRQLFFIELTQIIRAVDISE